MEDTQQFLIDVAKAMAYRFRDLAAKESNSRAIGESLQVVSTEGKVAVETPYYWALYYHDGRGAIKAKSGHRLVYFKDIADDPRISGRNYPERASDVKRLTKDQFYKFLRDPSKGMVVADRVGPTEGDPFFTRAGRKFGRIACQVVESEMSSYVRSVLGDLMDIEARGVIDL